MTVMDKYVERFREGMDDEFQLDVMYRAYVIFAGFSANVSLACAAVLSWILPPDYVLVSYIMGVPLFAGEIAASWYASKRVIRPRINVWGRSRLSLVLTIIWGIAWLVGLTRFPAFAESPVAVRGMIIGAIAGSIAVTVGMRWFNTRARAWDKKRLDSAEEDD